MLIKKIKIHLYLFFCIMWLPGTVHSQIMPEYILVTPEYIAQLPTTGIAWENLVKKANYKIGTPNLSYQDDMTNVYVLAKALVFARLGEEKYRQEVIKACMAAINTEDGGNTLAFGREFMAYLVAAQLVKLPRKEKTEFDSWVRSALNKNLSGRTLRSTHEERPNNWGTHAGASRIAAAIYLGDKQELSMAANVFRAWLGEPQYHNKFKFKDKDRWQYNPSEPVGINPKGATKQGEIIDGVLPEEQRRAGHFSWPPKKENYVYEGLQGALAQAVFLKNAGYDSFNWSNKALLRAFQWLYNEADFPAEGDDTWQIYVINHFYNQNFPVTIPSKPGKSLGWTDWIYMPSKK